MKKISIILGILLTLVSFSGCNDNSTQQETETTTENPINEEFVVKGNTIPDEYSELFNTWYSAYDVIAFTDDGEFYLTYDDISYCISGTYTIEDDTIKIIIDTDSIKDKNLSVGDTDYKFKFVDDNLILTLADDETQSVTYYLDKSVALGQSD